MNVRKLTYSIAILLGLACFAAGYKFGTANAILALPDTNGAPPQIINRVTLYGALFITNNPPFVLIHGCTIISTNPYKSALFFGVRPEDIGPVQ